MSTFPVSLANFKATSYVATCVIMQVPKLVTINHWVDALDIYICNAASLAPRRKRRGITHT